MEPITHAWYAKAHYSLALAYHRRGKLREAQVEYERAIEARPEYADALNNLAVVHAARGERHEAIELLKRALTATPTQAGARMRIQTRLNLGRLYLAGGDAQAAASCFAEATGFAEAREPVGEAPQGPPRLEPLYWLAYALLRQGDASGAAERLRALLRTDPDHREARLGLARCLLDMGEIEAARSEVAHVLARDPADQQAQNLAGVIAFKAGSAEEAMTCFERAIARDPSYGPPYKNMAVARYAQRDYAGAEAALLQYTRRAAEPEERRRAETLIRQIERAAVRTPREAESKRKTPAVREETDS